MLTRYKNEEINMILNKHLELSLEKQELSDILLLHINIFNKPAFLKYFFEKEYFDHFGFYFNVFSPSLRFSLTHPLASFLFKKLKTMRNQNPKSILNIEELKFEEKKDFYELLNYLNLRFKIEFKDIKNYRYFNNVFEEDFEQQFVQDFNAFMKNQYAKYIQVEDNFSLFHYLKDEFLNFKNSFIHNLNNEDTFYVSKTYNDCIINIVNEEFDLIENKLFANHLLDLSNEDYILYLKNNFSTSLHYYFEKCNFYSLKECFNQELKSNILKKLEQLKIKQYSIDKKLKEAQLLNYKKEFLEYKKNFIDDKPLTDNKNILKDFKSTYHIDNH